MVKIHQKMVKLGEVFDWNVVDFFVVRNLNRRWSLSNIEYKSLKTFLIKIKMPGDEIELGTLRLMVTISNHYPMAAETLKPKKRRLLYSIFDNDHLRLRFLTTKKSTTFQSKTSPSFTIFWWIFTTIYFRSIPFLSKITTISRFVQLFNVQKLQTTGKCRL